MAKETDLLKDPVSLAQLRYKEQVDAFKAQYIPKPPRSQIKNMLRKQHLRPEIILGGK